MDRQNKKAVSEANKYFMIEGCIALFVSFILNLFVVTVFANGLYGITNEQAYNKCIEAGSIFADTFENIGPYDFLCYVAISQIFLSFYFLIGPMKYCKPICIKVAFFLAVLSELLALTFGL